MKLSRLLSILIILLNQKTITATQLAERFEVSVRTIYRDIEMLSAAGIPIYTTQGMNGGISIMESYTLNRTLLTKEEKDEIIFALNSLKATEYPDVNRILEKLGTVFQIKATDWISIDFSPWGSHPNVNNKFSDIKYAILQKHVIKINYINAKNMKSIREVEPLRLEFKHSAWYLYAWCRKHMSFRSFRVSRIKDLQICEEIFDLKLHESDLQKENDVNNDNNDNPWNYSEHFVLQFNEAALFRLYDEYDDNYIHCNGDGTYTLEIDFPEDEWVYGYILSFGPNVKVIEPEHVKKIILDRSKKIYEIYS